MAFAGIGGGVNLGAATGYLFIDGRGMRQGLNTAQGALEDFQAKTEAHSKAIAQAAARDADAVARTAGKTAQAQADAQAKIDNAQVNRVQKVSRAIAQEQAKIAALQAKATAAASQAAKTAVLTDPAKQKELENLANDVAAANVKASDTIAAGYEKRTLAEAEYQKVVKTGEAEIEAANLTLEHSLDKRIALTEQLALVQAKLDSGAGTTAARRSLGGQKSQLNRKIGITDAEIASAEAAIAKLETDIAVGVTRAAQVARDAILQTIAEEQIAINEASLAIERQAKAYADLAAIAGPAVTKLAAGVEAAAQRSVVAANKLEATNAKLAEQQAITASSTDVGAVAVSVAAEKKLLDQRLKDVDSLNRANADFVTRSEALNARLVAVGEADAAASLAATNAVVAQKAESTAKITALTSAEAAKVTQITADENAKVLAVESAGMAERVAVHESGLAKIEASEEALAASAKNASLVNLNGIMHGATVGAVAFGAAIFGATKAFAGFDEQMHNVASISDDVNGALTGMKDHVLELAKNTGQAPEDLAKALYDIVSSGFQGQQALDLLDASAKAAVAGLSDVTTAGKSLTAVINAYKTAQGKANLQLDDLGKISDIAFQAVKDGVFSFQDLTEQQGDNLAIAAELGVTYEELASSYVILTKQGNSLSESTTQINGILRTLIKPNDELAAAIAKYGKEVLHVTGLTGSALIANYGFGEALKFVGEATGGSAEAIARLFPNVRALRGELGLGGRNLAEYTLELERMSDTGARVGATQRALAIQQQSFAFQLRQVKQEVFATAFAFGAQLAPGVLVAAKAVGVAASVMGTMPQLFKGIIAGTLGFGFAVSSAVLIIGKLVQFVNGARNNLLLFKKAILDSSKAMKVLTFLTSPLGLVVVALGAIAVVTGALIAAHRAHAREIKALDDAYKHLEGTISNLRVSGEITKQQEELAQSMVDQLKTLTNLGKQSDSLGVKAQRLQQAIANASLAGKDTVDFDGQTLSLQKASDLLEQYKAGIDAAADGAKTAQAAVDGLNSILLTNGLDIGKVVADLKPFFDGMANGTKTIDDVANEIKHIGDNIETFKIGAGDAKEKIASLGDSLDSVDEFFGSAEDNANNFRKAMQGLVSTAETTAGAMMDLSSPLAFIQQQLGNTGDSVATTLLKLNKLGTVSFKGDEIAVLEIVSAMDQWQAKIDEVNAHIQTSQSSISDWNNIIQTVGDTIGTSADGYANLNKLVADGKLNQEQANAALQAGIFLQGAATNGIEDEQAAIAKSLPDLASFVQQHEIAVKNYNDLDPAARGFADSLKDATTQAVLMTIIMAKLANALSPDTFPDEFVTKLILDVSQADPVLAATLDEFGLIPPEIKSQITVVQDPKNRDTLLKTRKALIDERVKIRTNPFSSPEDLARLKEIDAQLQGIDSDLTNITFDVTVDPPDAISDTTAQLQAAQAAAKAAADAINAAFTDANTSIKDVAGGVAQALPGLIETASRAADFSDPVAFLKQNLKGVGNTIDSLVLKGAQMGQISLTGAQKSALKTADALANVTSKIAKLDDEIANNQSDMQMWQGRIDLVDNTIGSATDTYVAYEQQLADGTITQEDFNKAVADGSAHHAYAELNQLLETGRITQAQYNDILQHAIHLRERSVGGVLDERAAIALAIPDLDNFITSHDNLDGAYNNLTSEQKGFLSALNDEAVQTALNTEIMLAFLETMGKVPEGTSANFAKMVSANNPEVAAVFNELNILGAGATIPLKADTKDADTKIDQTQANATTPVTVPVTAVVQGDGTGGPDSDLLSDKSFTVTADTKPAQTAMDALVTHANDQIAILLESGTSAGIAYVDGWVAGFNFKLPDVSSAVFDMETFLGRQNDGLRLIGSYAGKSYDYGIADGVYEGYATVQSAGRYIGALLHSATLEALAIHSPSKKGAEASMNYLDGIVLGLSNGEMAAVSKAASVAKNVHGAFTKEFAAQQMGIRDMQAGNPGGGSRFGVMPIQPSNVGGATHNNAVALTIHVNGVGDTEAVATRVKDTIYQELDGSFRRLAAQGK